MSGRGELERAVLHVLWERPAGITARELVSSLPGRELALTTVLTVLDRLRAKSVVERDERTRPHIYKASVSREDFVADIMLDALGQASDRDATLARFLGGVTESDSAHLRRLLHIPRQRRQTRTPLP